MWVSRYTKDIKPLVGLALAHQLLALEPAVPNLPLPCPRRAVGKTAFHRAEAPALPLRSVVAAVFVAVVHRDVVLSPVGSQVAGP